MADTNVMPQPISTAVFGMTRNMVHGLSEGIIHSAICANGTPATTETNNGRAASSAGFIWRTTLSAYHGLTAMITTSASFTAAMLSVVTVICGYL